MGLDELALCVRRENLPKIWLQDDLALRFDEHSPQLWGKIPYEYRRRREIETDYTYKQLIPYVIIRNRGGDVLIYRRAGSECRLHNLWSVGIGGHVTIEDDVSQNCWESMLRGMQRECFEELNCENLIFTPLGIINEEQTEVGHAHLGVVFSAEITESFLPDKELADAHFVSLSSSATPYKFELWSSLAIKLLSS